ELRNPYYGSEMLRCGEGTRSLPLADVGPADLDAQTRSRIDAVLRAYLDLTAELALDRDDPDGQAELLAAVVALREAGPPEIGAAVETLHGTLVAPEAAAAGDLASRRRALVPVSDALIALLRVARPSDAFGRELHVMHCPMVPADWVQTDETLRNPYYGAEMLR